MEGDSLACMDWEVCCGEAAQCLCFDCSPKGRPLCSSCSELLHRNPKRTGHSLVSIISHKNLGLFAAAAQNYCTVIPKELGIHW